MDLDFPLRDIVAAWAAKIRKASEVKKARFGDDAAEAMKFFNGPHGFNYKSPVAPGHGPQDTGEQEVVPEPSWRVVVNRVAELVQLFGPVLYHKNPFRQVNPRKVPAPPIEMLGDPANPFVQQAYQAVQQQMLQTRAVDKTRAQALEFYLNYTPTELGLRDEARNAIDEALIKGMGLLWTELYQPPGSQHRLVGSFFGTVDELQIDPDMEQLKDCKWVARKCIHPVWEVEEMYGLEPGTLKAQMESYNRQGEVDVSDDGDYERKRGNTNDLCVYYKVWSKMGFGSRLKGVTEAMYADQPISQVLDQMGPFVHLVVCEGVPYPLNLPPAMTGGGAPPEQILQACEWPIPYWADGEWPFTPIAFHWVPRQAWPMSHMKPGMGEMKFLNWAYSHLASKIRTTSRDFVAVLKSAGEEIKSTIQSGKDLTIIELEAVYEDVKKVVQFIQSPQFNGDIWKVIAAVEQNFEKRIGLTELVYGMSGKQMRSAEEATIRGNQVQVRPDDMAEKVEQAMTVVARKEALAARWCIQPEEVQIVMGPVGAQLWQQFVYSADVYEVVHQLEYRIEAGSTRKPNKERDAANMAQAMQNLFGPMMQYAMQTGDFGAINALIADWAKSIDLDPEKYLFKPPPPPPMPAPAPAPGQRPGPAPGPAPAPPR